VYVLCVWTEAKKNSNTFKYNINPTEKNISFNYN